MVGESILSLVSAIIVFFWVAWEDHQVACLAGRTGRKRPWTITRNKAIFLKKNIVTFSVSLYFIIIIYTKKIARRFFLKKFTKVSHQIKVSVVMSAKRPF